MQAVRSSSRSLAILSWRQAARSTCLGSDIVVVPTKADTNTTACPRRAKQRVDEAPRAPQATGVEAAAALAVATTAAQEEAAVGTVHKARRHSQTHMAKHIQADTAGRRTDRQTWWAG